MKLCFAAIALAVSPTLAQTTSTATPQAAPSPSEPAPRSADVLALFVVPEQGLRIEPGTTLAQLLAAYAERNHWSLLASDRIRRHLEAEHVPLLAALDVAPAALHAVVERLVCASGLRLRFVHAQAPVVVRVEDPGERSPAEPLGIERSELERWVAHPAFAVSLVLPVPEHLDPFKLAAALRDARIADVTDSIVPLAGQKLLLNATGPEVASIVATVERASAPNSGRDEATGVPLPESGIELLRTPGRALHVEARAKNRIVLADVLAAYAQLMGWQLVLTDDVRRTLEQSDCPPQPALDVPAENVHLLVESLTRAHQFALRFRSTHAPVLLEVQSVSRERPMRERPQPQVIAPEELARWVAHPGFLVATTLHFRGMDPAKLADSLRLLDLSSDSFWALPLSESDAVYLGGFAPDLAGIVRSLGDLGAQAGQAGAALELPQAPTGVELFVRPVRGLHLEDPERSVLKVNQLLAQYEQVTGWHMLISRDTLTQLQQLQTGLTLPLDVPPERVHAVVEAVLAANEFVIRFATTSDPVVVVVEGLNTPGKGSLRIGLPVVPPSELQRWSEHPARLVTTTFRIPGVDVRTLSNSLRQMLSDQLTQQIIPVGDSTGLLVTGHGSEVAQLAGMLRGLSPAEPGGASGLQTPPLPSASGAAELALLAPPAQALHLEAPAPQPATLLRVLEVYTQLAGWRLLVDADVRRQLSNATVELGPAFDVPGPQVHGFVESLLHTRGFGMRFAHVQSPVLLEIERPDRGWMSQPLVVPATDLPRWSLHPAILVQTTIEFAHTDVRTLSNSLRQFFSDASTQRIVPVGNSNALIVVGFAEDVARLAMMIGAVDRAAAGDEHAREALQPPAQVLPSGIELFVTPTRPLHLDKPDGKPLTAEELLRAYTQLLGWRADVSREVAIALHQTKCTLALPLDVPPERVHSFAEGVLAEHDFVLHFAHARDPVVLGVDSTQTPGRMNLRMQSAVIPVTELPRWAEHPAFLVSLALRIPGVDMRPLSNQLRQRFTDAQTQQVIPLGEDGGMFLTAFAPQLLGCVQLILSGTSGAQSLPRVAPDASAPLFPLGADDLLIEAPDGREETALAIVRAFARWSNRELEISHEAEQALTADEHRPLLDAYHVPRGMVYAFVASRLERANCRLIPAPLPHPTRWVVELPNSRAYPPLDNLPEIALADLTAWSGYGATPFRTTLALDGAIDPKRVVEYVRQLQRTGDPCLVLSVGEHVLALAGTPAEIQRAAGAVLQACAPDAQVK